MAEKADVSVQICENRYKDIMKEASIDQTEMKCQLKAIEEERKPMSLISA